MAYKTKTLSTNLTAGEISPRSMGRFDIAKFANGAKLLENFLIHNVGGAIRRPGTRYVADTKYSSTKTARLLPFQYSVSQDYVIEAGDLYFRFFDNNATTVSTTSWDTYTKLLLHADGTDASTTIIDEIGNTMTAYSDAQIDTAQSKFGGASILLDGTNDYVHCADSADWNFGTGDFTIDFWVRFNSTTGAQSFCGQFEDSTNRWRIQKSATTHKLDLFFTDGSTKADYGMTSNWSVSANTWYHLAFVRSGTSVYIFIDGVSQALTTATAISTNDVGNISGVLEIGNHSGADGGYLNGWIDEFRISKGTARWTTTFTPPTAPYAMVDTLVDVTTPYLEAEVDDLQYAQKNDVMYIVHPYYNPRKLVRTSSTTFTISEVPFVRGPFMDENVTGTTITNIGSTGAGVTLTASANLFDGTHVDSYWKVSNAVVKIVQVDSATVAVGTVQDEPDGTAGNIGGAGTTTSWAEGAFSGYRGYPNCVCFHEQRLYYANTATEKQKFWGSVVQAYDNFDEGAAAADDAVTYELSSNQVNEILWLHSNGSVLQLGTSGGTFTASGGGASSGEMITPSNIYIVNEIDFGCAAILPAPLSSYLYYVQRNLNQLREIKYNIDSDRQVAEDMNKFADHVLRDGSGAVELWRQQSPGERIWVLRYDGQICVLARDVSQEILGWSRIIAGTDSTDEGMFESMTIIPKSNEDDQIWGIVKRKINGVTKRFVEYFTAEMFDQQWDAVQLDCSLTYDSPATITGITNANPAVVTASNTLVDGDYVRIDEVVGATEFNGNTYKVSLATTASFALRTTADVNVNSTAYGTYISGGEARKKVLTVSGLSHLEGETVQVQADGVAPTSNSFVVASGAITLADRAAVVHVGLPYVSKIQLLKFSDGGQNPGEGQFKIRRVYDLALRLYRSLGGFFIGQDASHLKEETLSSATTLQTGDFRPVMEGWYEKEAELIIQQSKPHPLNILAMTFKSETEEL